MLHKVIDNRGLSCPQPVINTKKALEELLQGGQKNFILTVIVDNEAAQENVTRLARTLGYGVAVEEREDGTHLFIQAPTEKKDCPKGSKPEVKESCFCAGKPTERPVLLITAATLGQGSEELGKILMRSFIYSLQETYCSPAKMYFLNSGVFLTTEGSPVLEELYQLVEMGVEVFSCGTCLDYYQLKNKLAVGKITNMYDTVEMICSATKCITL